MSFANAYLPVQRNLFSPRWTLDTKNINTLLAVLDASRKNTTIREEDTLSQGEPGKLRPLKINYYPPICDDDGDCSDNICDAGTVVEPSQDWFEIAHCTASKVYQVNPNDIRQIDGQYSFTDAALDVIFSALPTVREKLSNDIATLLVAETGVLPDGNASRLLPFVNTDTAAINPAGIWQIRKDYQDSGYGMPYIIGGSAVNFWQQTMNIAGLNSTTGQDFSKLDIQDLYYDNLINDTYGVTTNEHIIAFTPQMLKFVTFSKNAGIFATDVNNIQAIQGMWNRGVDGFVKGGLVDPRTGLLWDLNIDYDKCANNGDGAWKIQWKLYWDIFFMPSRICNVDGVNGIFHYTTCLPQAVDCGTNPAPSPAPTRNYSASAADITYPLIVQKTDIRNNPTVPGIINEPNPVVSVADITELAALLTEYSNGNVTFGNSGSNLTYTGHIARTVKINNNTTLTFS